MKYDFDKIIDRSGSGDLKHEVQRGRGAYMGATFLFALKISELQDLCRA